MTLNVKFSESKQDFNADFGEVHNISDGGYERGFAEGEKAEYDAFWDAFQDYGNRQNYDYAFQSYYWTKSTFKPKYDIKPTRLGFAFQSSELTGNFNEILRNCGVKLDMTDCTYVTYAFHRAKFERFEEFDASKVSAMWNVFSGNQNLHTIDRLIVSEKATSYDGCFNGCTALENITIEGVIAGKNLSFQSCKKLSHDSIVSIMTAVSATKSVAITLSLTSVNNAFETSAGAADGSTSAEWNALVATRPNCTVSLL